MSELTDVRELQGSRHSLKRLQPIETSPGSTKKPKMKHKAAVAMRSLLNLLHITDRRKESFTDETSAASVIQDSITGHVPRKMSSQRILHRTDSSLLDGKEYDSLSKTWSYFVSDQSEEVLENENSTKNQTSDNVGIRECYIEREYCQNDSNDLNQNVTLVQKPLACRSKMGISVLQDINTAKLYAHGMSSLEFKHQSEPSLRQDASLSAISTDHRFGLPIFKDEHDSADVSNEDSRKAPLSDSSLVPKASFTSIEPGICDEPSGPRNHFSFLPVKSTHNSKMTESGSQPVDESRSPKNLITVSSNHILVSSPRTDTTASNVCFQDTRYESNLRGQEYESNLRGQEYESNLRGQEYESNLRGQEYESNLRGQEYESNLRGQEYESDLRGQEYESDLRGQEYESDLRGQEYDSDLRGQEYESDLRGQEYESDLRGQEYESDLRGQEYESNLRGQEYESDLRGQAYESKLKSQQFSANRSSLLPLKVTQSSKCTGSEPQLVNESPRTINLMKHPTNKIQLQNPIFATIASNTNVEALQDGSALTGQHLVSQCLDFGESLHAAVVPDSVSQSSSMYSNRRASCPAVENDRSSTGEITTSLSSYQAAATLSMYSQQRSSLQSDYSSYSSPLVVQAASQHASQHPQLAMVAVPSTIATKSAINSAGHKLVPVRAIRQLGSHEEPNVSLTKSARRCLHGHLKHQYPDASLESPSMPKRTKILEYGIHKSPTISAYKVDSKTTVNVECKKSADPANVSTVNKTSSGSYGSHPTANYPLMSAVLKQRTLHHSEKKPSNVSFRTTDYCSVHPSKLPEVDVNGNYVVLIEDRSVLSPRAKQHRTPVNVIPAPLLTSSPMHPKRKPGANDEVLQPLQDFMSPVRHNPKSEMCSAITKDSTPRRTRRRQHKSKRCNRLTIYGNLDTSSDQELDFVRPCGNDYVLLARAAGLIVNRLPFQKDMKPSINMDGLMQYLQSFYLGEISTLSSRHILTISEYRILKTESCQIFRPDQLTHETCLSELLASVLVQEPVLVQICSNFIFENLRFLAGCSDLYNMPPELFLMLLSNKGIVLGYHGFPLPYEESVRQVQRAGRKYIQAHKTGSAEKDSKLEKMLSFVIDETAALKSSHGDHGRGETNFKQLYHEIKYTQSEQFVTDKSFSHYRFLPNLAITAAGSLQAGPKVESSDQVMSYHKYCSNAYILRRIYFSYIIQDKIPYISQIRQQYAVQGRKVTYSIGSSPSKPGFESLQQSANPDQNLPDPCAACTSDSSEKLAALPKSDPLTTVAAAGTSPGAYVEDSGLTPEPAGRLKMSAVQLARGEHITGIMAQGESVLHNIMVITNKGRYIRAHGIVDFPGSTGWTLVPPPSKFKYCLQAIVADSRTVSFQTYLQSVRVVWAVLCPGNDMNN